MLPQLIHPPLVLRPLEHLTILLHRRFQLLENVLLLLQQRQSDPLILRSLIGLFHQALPLFLLKPNLVSQQDLLVLFPKPLDQVPRPPVSSCPLLPTKRKQSRPLYEKLGKLKLRDLPPVGALLKVDRPLLEPVPNLPRPLKQLLELKKLGT